MRILWLTENYFPSRGGMAQSCDRIVHALRSSGVEIDLVHFTTRTQHIKEETRINGNYISVPFEDDEAHTLNLLWNHLTHPNYTSSYTHILAFGGHLPILAAPIFASWLNVALITCIRGNDFDVAVFNPKRRAVLRDALLKSEVVCSVSQSKIEKIKSWLPSINIEYTPNGIDTEDWKAGKREIEKAQSLRKNWTESGKRVLGLFGHLKAKKGLPLLIRALQHSGYKDKVHLLLTGQEEGMIMPNLSEDISYTLLPFLDRYELIPYYLACDTVCIPSHYEGMPNVLLEAGALGIPFIASRVDGMADILIEGEHGFLFHPGDMQGCSKAIQKWIKTEASELEQMAKACQQLILEQYHHKRECELYKNIFYRTLHKIES